MALLPLHRRDLYDAGGSAWAPLRVLLPVSGWVVLIVSAVRPGALRPYACG